MSDTTITPVIPDNTGEAQNANTVKGPVSMTRIDGVRVGIGGDTYVLENGKKVVVKEATKAQYKRLEKLGVKIPEK